MELLTSVINQLEFKNNSQDEEKQLAKIKENFDYLSYISQGLSSVAAQLWLQSLSLANLENINTQTENIETILVEYKKVKLLDLPESELTSDDRYLLFSMLLHKEINLSHLALSLGEPENIIQFQIEKLLRLGIIQRLNNLFSVHPAHYLKLCRHLKKYNFITDLIE